MGTSSPPVSIGLPQWFHAAWPFTPRSDDALARYSRHFDTVEGNTTFYGLPKPDTVRAWQAAVPAHFRFCFKFPRSISHDAELHQCGLTPEMIRLSVGLETVEDLIWDLEQGLRAI